MTAECGPDAQADTSDADRKACEPDVYRLCGDRVPNADLITACLTQQRAKLSAPCKAAFARNKK